MVMWQSDEMRRLDELEASFNETRARMETLYQRRGEMRYSQGRLQGSGRTRAHMLWQMGLILMLASLMPWWLSVALGVAYVVAGIWMVADCRSWVEEWKP